MVKISVKRKDGLPREAFALTGNPEEPDTWYLPHHKKSILRVQKGKAEVEDTVDWGQLEMVVEYLSPASRQRLVLQAEPGQIMEAAKHLAGHYQQAGKPLPDVLAALV